MSSDEKQGIYQQGRNVVDMHQAPRFGHSSDISKLASSSADEQHGYIYGVVSFSAFLFFFFLLWLVVLSILKVAGHDIVGCASGRVVQKDRKRKSRKEARKREDRIQIIFLLSGFCVLLSCGIMLGLGLPVTQQALADIIALNADAKILIYEGITVREALSRTENYLGDIQVLSLLNLTTFCPGMKSSVIMNETGIETAVRSIFEAYDEISVHMSRETLLGASSDLEEVLTISKDVDWFVRWITEKDWQPKMFVLFLCVFTSFLMGGAWCSRTRRSTPPLRCMLAYLITPSFVIVIFGGLIALCGIAAVTVMNADFCSGGEYPGSPEETVMNILYEKGFSPGDMIYDAFTYYQNGCLGSYPFEFLDRYESTVSSAIVSSAEFLTSATDLGVEIVEHECTGDAESMIENMRQLVQSLEDILDVIHRCSTMVKCNRVGPIYRQIFRGPTCAESVYGLSCTFATYFAICVFGMTMVSLRAAMYRRLVQDGGGRVVDNDGLHSDKQESPDDEMDEWEEYRKWMSQYYDTEEWKLKSSSTAPGRICPAQTFETEDMSQVSNEPIDMFTFGEDILDESTITTREFEPLSPPLKQSLAKTGNARMSSIGLKDIISEQTNTMKLFRQKDGYMNR